VSFDLGFPIQPRDATAARRAGLKTGDSFSGEALVIVHHGPYEALAQSYRALEQDLKERGLTGRGDVWEIYLNDPDETPSAELLTEIYWPIERGEPSNP
jgi:effector-binding domain-containing protein